jgi:hypothetical protein
VISSAVTKVKSKFEEHVTRFSPQATVWIEGSDLGQTVRVGNLVVGKFSHYKDDRFILWGNGDNNVYDVGSLVARLMDLLSQKLKSEPTLLEELNSRPQRKR